ncbi:MAG: NUDIX domain-containing protein [Melioribacteraceae bacterium]|nr:NUDIX domain-containing protein [Melioribacteraceae bacterium]
MGGVVSAGEEYDDSAKRELAEELGITNIELIPHFKFFYEDGKNKVWGKVYHVVMMVKLFCRKRKLKTEIFIRLKRFYKCLIQNPLHQIVYMCLKGI